MCVRPLLALAAVAAWCAPMLAAPARKLPELVLWSWFVDDDLRFLNSAEIGVAYLALSLEFEGTQVISDPRTQPVRISRDTWQMAVVRCNYGPSARPQFTEAQRRAAARMIAELATITQAPAVQIDFDAPPAAYGFYRQLLSDVRTRLGPNVFLSMTALVNWCQSSTSWLAGVPVDEVVPMAFYMGQAASSIITMLHNGGSFVFPACRQSIGVELAAGATVRPRKNQRTYVFVGSQKWSPGLVRAARNLVTP
ncbi:MAG: hypothetical protein JO336_23585 [Acidobacteriia bacterium]|nr:hypothetical protein [Terriglobia bacterium]